MPVRIVHLGATESAVVEEVEDGGRRVIAGGAAYTLRPVNGRFVREGEPSYGTRLIFEEG